MRRIKKNILDLVSLVEEKQMSKKYGVSSTGLIAPIIREGDDLCKIVCNTVFNAIDNVEDGDIIGITESVVARAQGNYVTVDEVAKDIKKKKINI